MPYISRVCVCVCVCVFVIPLESRFQEGEQAWQSRCYVSQYHGIDEKVLCVKSVWEPKICRLERNEREREREKADVTEFCQQVSRREVADFELKMYHCDDE